MNISNDKWKLAILDANIDMEIHCLRKMWSYGYLIQEENSLRRRSNTIYAGYWLPDKFRWVNKGDLSWVTPWK